MYTDTGKCNRRHPCLRLVLLLYVSTDVPQYGIKPMQCKAEQGMRACLHACVRVDLLNSHHSCVQGATTCPAYADSITCSICIWNSMCECC